MADAKDFPDEGGCPILGKCVKHKCPWYIQVMGQHPQTGEQLNKFACAIAWLPTLLIENSQQQRQTGAAVETLRNEVVKSNGELAASIAAFGNFALGAARLAAPKDVTPHLENKD